MSASGSNDYPTTGDIIDGKYQIERRLGEGGMGAVARAVHLLLRAPVALKFMNPQFMTFPGAVERFLNEGIASKAIKSEHVVQVDDVGKLPSGAPYLVMDCLDGCDLSELLVREGAPGLEIKRCIHFVVQILRGLQVAHAIGIIHRDMKPSNCFVVKHEGLADFVKILDFGISKVQQPGSASLTQTNSALGTPLYMSPEQARSPRDVDARSDIYSVGVILYELLTGNTPFNSESGEFTEILFKLFTADAPRIEGLRPDIEKGLADVCHKALARDVKDRFQTASEMAEALLPFAMPSTAALIERIRIYQPESRSSIMPRGANSPSSALAFSALQGAHTKAPAADHFSALPPSPQTQAMPGEAHARTQVSTHDDLSPSPRATAALQVAPSPVMHAGVRQATQVLAKQPAATQPQPRSDAHRNEGRAEGRSEGRAEGRDEGRSANAQTNGGVRTNLAVARDTTDAELTTDTATKRSPAVYVVPAIALVALAGLGFALKGKLSGTATPDPASVVQNTPNATGPSSASTLPPSPAGAISASAGATAVGMDATGNNASDSKTAKDAGAVTGAVGSTALKVNRPTGGQANGGTTGNATSTSGSSSSSNGPHEQTPTPSAHPHVLDNNLAN